MSNANNANEKSAEQVSSVVIRFAGDSGDGMQLTGTQFTNETARAGNDLRTFPDFPAEIRAPTGTLAGVSAFQLRFADDHIYTPGDRLDVLVAMNPAALKTNLSLLKSDGILVVNTAQFEKRDLEKAGYDANPIKDGSLSGYKMYAIDISGLTAGAVEKLGLPSKLVDRCKNFFALGLLFWMYSRSLDNTLLWIESKFGKKPEIAEANCSALKAGYYYGETTEVFDQQFKMEPAKLPPGTYRNISGNTAAAFGMMVAAKKAKLDLFLGSYPITPASDILHELSNHKNFGVKTFQAEDEIAAMCATIGAAFGGALALTTTSGPGVALKSEALGLAVMVELPMVVINVQRGGPSTGLPTKTEQADLAQALYGRNGEAPMPVIAARSPADCFDTAIEASRIALKYMTPVMMLTDGALANGTEPWKLPDLDSMPALEHRMITEETDNFLPYIRDPKTLSRPWARLGTPGLEHRIGGLEKEHLTGAVCYDGKNHEFMIRMREEKLQRVAQEIQPTEILGDQEGDLLMVGWGSTHGVIRSAVEVLRKEGKKVSAIHLRYIDPLPPDLGDIFKRFKTIACPEMNLGQLARVLREKHLVDIQRISKVQGQPFTLDELKGRADELLAGKRPGPFLVDTFELLNEDAAPSSNPLFARYQ